jgi:ABC-2 type transport system ATP-binding protein
MAELAVEIRGLTKTYRTGFRRKRFVALNNLDLEVEEGSILGLLGPNGAGKTTTFKLILGLIYPDHGSIFSWAKPSSSSEAKSRIGYLPENPYFYPHLTAVESLDFYGRLFNLPKQQRRRRVDELLTTVGLEHARDRQLRKFSRGMLQRIGIAQALINDPKLLILDEPMSGLDPMGRKEMRDIIIGCRKQDKTVIFSSHILSDVEVICDSAAIILEGQLQEIVQVDEFLDKETNIWELSCTNLSPELSNILTDKAIETTQTRGRLLVKMEGEDVINDLMIEIKKHGGRLISFGPRRDSLEDIFVKRATERRDSWEK